MYTQKILGMLRADGEPGWRASTLSLLLSSPLNAFLCLLPLSLIADKLGWDASIRFAFSFVAIIPLAVLLEYVIDQLSMYFSTTLPNVLFGNAMAGLVLSNQLLILGTSFLAGGLRYHEQNFQVTATQTGVSLMTLACITLVIPAAHQAAQNPSELLSIEGTLSVFNLETNILSGRERPHEALLLISRSTAIILSIVYICYLVFQLKTHTDIFANPEVEEEETGERPRMSRVSAGTWLLVVGITTYFPAKILVGSIEQTADKYYISKSFVGLIILPLVANAPEHLKSIRMAIKDRVEYSVSICVGNSIQIATLVVPFLVITSWIIGDDLTLYFADFETISLFVSVVLVNLLIMDGKSNYMEGLMLCSLYVVIAIALWVS
ncbi:hypothetical protein FRC07_009275 [Ceratobasidium sp. 392]|nr:hypothetical protein FRC07_009275 [Ceratobasidium sp. 392]